MDLSRWEEIKELGERFVKEKVYIMYLINNAGMAKFCSYGDLSVEESLHMVNLNISGVVAMGLVCLFLSIFGAMESGVTVTDGGLHAEPLW